MGTRTSHPPGTFSWVDLQTTDLDAAKAFYNALFAWDYDDMPMGDGNFYSMAKVGGEHVCAIGGLPDESIPPHWNSYVTVASADDAMARARELGGGVIIEEAFDVFTAGRMGLLTDPTGAALCVWQPRDHIGARRVNEVGCLCWNELGTNDPEAAARFYGELFGWTFDENDFGGDTYRTIHNGERMNGGIRAQSEMEAGIPPNWLPYFTIADADATAAKVEDQGGRVLAPPMTLPTPNQPRIAVFADPQGAAFAVFQGETQD